MKNTTKNQRLESILARAIESLAGEESEWRLNGLKKILINLDKTTEDAKIKGDEEFYSALKIVSYLVIGKEKACNYNNIRAPIMRALNNKFELDEAINHGKRENIIEDLRKSRDAFESSEIYKDLDSSAYQAGYAGIYQFREAYDLHKQERSRLTNIKPSEKVRNVVAKWILADRRENTILMKIIEPMLRRGYQIGSGGYLQSKDSEKFYGWY